MTTTVSSNTAPRRSWFAAKIAGFALVGLGVFAGGCNNAMKDENAALMQENAALRERVTQMETNQAAMQQQLAARQPTNFDDGGWSQPARGGERTRSAPRETVIPISGDILFDSGQATLKSTAKKDLDKVVRRSVNTRVRRRIEGHTDTDPIRKSNWPSNEAALEGACGCRARLSGEQGRVAQPQSRPWAWAYAAKNTKAASRRVEVVIVDSY